MKPIFFCLLFLFVASIVFSCNQEKQSRCLPLGPLQYFDVGKITAVSPYDTLFAVVQDGYLLNRKDGFIAIRSTLDASLKLIINPPYKSSQLSSRYEIWESLQFLPNEKIAFYLKTVGLGNCSFLGKQEPECVELFIWDIANNKIESKFLFKTRTFQNILVKEKIPVWGDYVSIVSRDAKTLISLSFVNIENDLGSISEQYSLDVWDIKRISIRNNIIPNRKYLAIDFLLWKKLQRHPFHDDLFYSFYRYSTLAHQGQFFVKFPSMNAHSLLFSTFIDEIGATGVFFHPLQENALSFLFQDRVEIWDFRQRPRVLSVYPKTSITTDLEKDKTHLTSFSFSSDGKTFALGGYYEKSQKAYLHFWDVEDDSFSFSLEPAITSGYCSKKDETIASCQCFGENCTYHRYKEGIGRVVSKVSFDAKQRSFLVESDKYLYIWKCGL